MSLDEFETTAILQYIQLLAARYPKRTYGPESGLLEFGAFMDVAITRPTWLKMKRSRECYANSLQALSTQFHGNDPVNYAEGYAVPKGGWCVPVQHAWLVDESGQVLDPTWEDSADCIYFGVTFKTGFVFDILDKAFMIPGILVHPLHMRRYFGRRDLFKNTLHERM